MAGIRNDNRASGRIVDVDDEQLFAACRPNDITRPHPARLPRLAQGFRGFELLM